uniref:Uncharacterized protein n=1 Tax=Anguilla anguilla TaxID=7936 RepID=A0A0E9T547_ANGAN
MTSSQQSQNLGGKSKAVEQWYVRSPG